MKLDVILNSSDRLVRIFGIFFITVTVSRIFSLEQFGEYSIVLTLKNILLVAVSFGVDGLLLRRFSKSTDQVAENLIRRVLTLKYIWACCLSLLTLLMLEADKTYVFLLLVSLSCFPLLTLESYFKARNQTKYVLLCSSITYISVALGVVWLNFSSAPADWYLYLIVIDPVVLALGLFLMYAASKKQACKNSTKDIPEYITQEFNSRTLLALSFSALAAVLLSRSDVLIVGYFYGGVEAAKITAISRLNALFFFPILAIQQVLLSASDRYDSDKLTSYISWLMLVYCSFITIFYVLIGNLILVTVYGDKFAGLNHYLVLYSLSNYFFMMPVVMAFWYYDYSLQYFVAMKNIVVVLIYLILASVSVVYFGMAGLIAAYIVSGFILFIIGDLFHPQAKNLKHLYFKVRG